MNHVRTNVLHNQTSIREAILFIYQTKLKFNKIHKLDFLEIILLLSLDDGFRRRLELRNSLIKLQGN